MVLVYLRVTVHPVTSRVIAKKRARWRNRTILMFLCSTLLHILFKNRLTFSSYLLECERLSTQNAQKLQLLKQHYHELIEAKNKEIRENVEAQERLRKQLNIIL